MAGRVAAAFGLIHRVVSLNAAAATRPAFMKGRRTPRPHSHGLQGLLLTTVSLALVACAVLFLPWMHCPDCRDCYYDEIVRFTRLPGVSRAEARKMIAWAEHFPCRRCGNLGRISLASYLNVRLAPQSQWAAARKIPSRRRLTIG